MNERVWPKRESPKEDCVTGPLRGSRPTPNRTLCGAADVVGTPPDGLSFSVCPVAGAPCETSWDHVPAVAVCLSSNVEDVLSGAAVVSAVGAL